jgi:hypothetical protein
MADPRPESANVHGDVEALSVVAVDRRSGSLRATLKKDLGERLGAIGDRLTGAALPFGAGGAAVLLCAGFTGLVVHRIAANRYEIELETGEDTETDEVTAAFLALKTSQFTKGRLPLLPPVTAEEWQAEMDEKFRAAEARAGEHATPR